MARQDESRDLRSVSKIANVSYGNHTIALSRSKAPGIKMWGKLDFLRNYCGWTIYWDNRLIITNKNYIDDDKPTTTKERIKKHNKMQ